MTEGDGATVHVHLDMSGLYSFFQGQHQTEAKARVDLDEVQSSSLRPALSSTILVLGMGPVSISMGPTPQTANEEARGLRPSSLAFAHDQHRRRRR